jgi:hypothetical protein
MFYIVWFVSSLLVFVIDVYIGTSSTWTVIFGIIFCLLSLTLPLIFT